MTTFSEDSAVWFDLIAEHPQLNDPMVQELDRISKMAPSKANFDNFRSTNFRTRGPWTYALRQFLHRMEEGYYRREFRYFAGTRRQASQVRELFSLFQQALHYNDDLQPNRRQRRQRRNARLPSEMPSGGFAISTYDQALIEENARDKFSKRYGDPDARAEFLDAGLIRNDGTPTTAGWHELTQDISTLEINASKWLRSRFESVRDEGHGNDDELIGTFWFDLDDTNQARLIEIGIEERIDMVDCSYGDLCETAFDGVSYFGGYILGGAIHFFDVELPD